KQSHSLLTFINSSKVNETDFAFDSLMHASKPVKNTGSLEIKVDAMATPGALVMLELNTTSGDAAKVRGSGNVIVDIDTGKDLFDIKGLYTVSEGEYRLNVANIASKNLTIDEGGTFEMFGDIMQSELNLTAKYKTKAPIGVLIGDTTSVSTRRNINCGIAATGKLINPELKFSIDIPDLDPTTKGKVESALNTDDKVMKQFITLLVTGGFIPNEQSGIMDNTKMLYSNASEMLANSLNSVFRQLDIPIDLGFTYQPGYNQKDIFDVALSTTLFNNRVTVSGSVGNKQYSTGNGNLAGDIDVEIKLDKNGRIRLSLFSHSADQYTNYLDQTQRNGAGIVWQEEFDTFDELYRKVFWSKKRMQEYMQSHIPD
ncbi:MAG: translocation/assembly module TamB domain-containing protein, partial [Bacteroidales bacterium]